MDAAQRQPAIAAITVIRRDGTALLRQERGGKRAAWALAAERARPYTDQEATQFLQLHRALRRALPKYRRELEEMAALARPLMPAGAQPARLGRPHPSLELLPVPRSAAGYDWGNSFSRAA